jgi:hypothetical protein
MQDAYLHGWCPRYRSVCYMAGDSLVSPSVHLLVPRPPQSAVAEEPPKQSPAMGRLIVASIQLAPQLAPRLLFSLLLYDNDTAVPSE